MIVGFDHDDESVFAAQREFLAAARISTAMVGMLSAIPKTPLHERLAAAGRLDPADDPPAGTNVLPLRMSREELSQGYVRLMTELYEADAYFDRLDDLYIAGGIETERAWQRYARAHPWRRRGYQLQLLAQAAGVALRLMWRVPDPTLRRTYRQRLRQVWRRRGDPVVLRIYAVKCAMHYHVHRLVQQQRSGTLVNTY